MKQRVALAAPRPGAIIPAGAAGWMKAVRPSLGNAQNTPNRPTAATDDPAQYLGTEKPQTGCFRHPSRFA